ncbi:hypothetical protein P5G51_000365 [Virgibacillus sp. 179-BFC.A HS]|uniref:Uncharacterized protein n=1 Tax=Tigheibacillus jepli TaxID=3035914 RepID=A0ABU5CE31_9BACI|nr:hypothetical protein [Virgibacillus sp. 179-BFC.A HS]MDY0404069.1 hypothetical protein [Virgibacillus sp. 179-BFC.A HS]
MGKITDKETVEIAKQAYKEDIESIPLTIGNEHIIPNVGAAPLIKRGVFSV